MKGLGGIGSEPLDEAELMLFSQEQTVLWQDWVERGPQGPIEDDEDAEFP